MYTLTSFNRLLCSSLHSPSLSWGYFLALRQLLERKCSEGALWFVIPGVSWWKHALVALARRRNTVVNGFRVRWWEAGLGSVIGTMGSPVHPLSLMAMGAARLGAKATVLPFLQGNNGKAWSQRPSNHVLSSLAPLQSEAGTRRGWEEAVTCLLLRLDVWEMPDNLWSLPFRQLESALEIRPPNPSQRTLWCAQDFLKSSRWGRQGWWGLVWCSERWSYQPRNTTQIPQMLEVMVSDWGGPFLNLQGQGQECGKGPIVKIFESYKANQETVK